MLELEEYQDGNEKHRSALKNLLRAYMLDKMGDSPCLTAQQEIDLVKGIEKHTSKKVIFAICDGNFAGLLVSFINFSTFAAKPFVNIHDIIVFKEFRGKGVGRFLMENIIKIANEIGCSKITLEVRHDNEVAQALYKSLDFKDTEPPMYFWSKNLKPI